MSSVSGGPPIHRREWMLFVDGENLTIRGQSLCAEKKVQLVEGPNYKEDCFLWFCGGQARNVRYQAENRLHDSALRAYYYTSVVGSDEILTQVKQSLRDMSFAPVVFRKEKNRNSKGVDIALTKDVLSHAFRGNFEIAVLVAGDADYLPLVEEVQRLGKLVYIWFYADVKVGGLNPALRLASDHFYDITTDLLWTRQDRR